MNHIGKTAKKRIETIKRDFGNLCLVQRTHAVIRHSKLEVIDIEKLAMQPDANRLSMPIFILSVTQDSSMQEVMDMRHCLT